MKVLLFCFIWIPGALMAQTKKKVTSTVTTKAVNGLPQSVNRGKAVYMTTCLSCHQIEGSGVPNMNPPLIGTSWVLGPKSVLITQVLKGSSGKVQIDGETFHNTMPPQPQLTDQQVADVLTYIRNSFGNKASMVTPAEVKAVRAKTK